MRADTKILVLQRWRQEDHEFKVILSYVVSWRLTWATREPVSKTATKAKQPTKSGCGY